MFSPQTHNVHPHAYGIVVLPDSRILSVRNIRVNSSWCCSMVIPMLNSKEDAVDVLKKELLARLGLDINNIKGDIGLARKVFPSNRNKCYVVHSFRARSSFRMELPGSMIAKGIFYKHILDALCDTNDRLDFSMDTEYVFRELFEQNWRPL